MIQLILSAILPWQISLYNYCHTWTIQDALHTAVDAVEKQTESYRRWCGYDGGDFVAKEIVTMCEEQDEGGWLCEADRLCLCKEKT